MNYHTHGAEYSRFTGRPEEGPEPQYITAEQHKAILIKHIEAAVNAYEKEVISYGPSLGVKPFEFECSRRLGSKVTYGDKDKAIEYAMESVMDEIAPRYLECLGT